MADDVPFITRKRREYLADWAGDENKEVEAVRHGKTYKPDPVLGSETLGSAWEWMGDAARATKLRAAEYIDPTLLDAGETDVHWNKLREKAKQEALDDARIRYESDLEGRPIPYQQIAWHGMLNGKYPGGK